MRTWLTERFALDVPLVGAPMFGVGAGELAAAISDAGALGMIGVGRTYSPQWLAEQCSIAAAAGRPFGVGLMAWALDQDDAPLEVVRRVSPALVSVSFGDFAKYVAPLREAGCTVTTQAGNLAEARAAEAAGVDCVVARGGEGGGHGRNEVGTIVLLQEVLDAVSVPVLAAGGIAGPRGLAAVIAAGAAGGWAGTAFLASAESDTSPAARERLLAAEDTDTAHGRVFDVAQRLDWPPEYGGRALRNTFFDTWADREDELATDDAAAEQLRSARAAGDYDTAYIYTGQAAALLRRQQAAGEIVADFATAADLLKTAGRLAGT